MAETPEKGTTDQEDAPSMGRRSVVAALASIPVFGVFRASFFTKKAQDDFKRKRILDGLGVTDTAPAAPTPVKSRTRGDTLRLGIIGYGGQGESVVRGAGFAHPDWPKPREGSRGRAPDTRLQGLLEQDDLNVELVGVCDLFDVRSERALAASRNDVRPGGGGGLEGTRRFRHYQEMRDSPDIDAVIIGTPDHWHAQITIDAVQAGKHVYCEKAMTRTPEEVVPLAEAIRGSNVVYQLGHQNRQLDSHNKALEIIEKDILGKITLIEMTTNRNSPNGAWVYDIHPEASPRTIDCDQFQEPSLNKVPFSRERFFRWRCWWDYGTGLAGDLLSHEYDAVNQILGLGIPKSAVASGGVYFFKDGRECPDVFQVAYEYPDRDLTVMYSATLANDRARGKVLMGHDASMEVGSGLLVLVATGSTRYEDWLEDEIVDPKKPLLSYQPGAGGVDAITSATEEYFASRGLLYTYQGGRRVSTLHLHMKEWIDCIRDGGQPSCGVEQAFEEAMTCHRATQSYLLGRKVEWDPVQKKIV